MSMFPVPVRTTIGVPTPLASPGVPGASTTLPAPVGKENEGTTARGFALARSAPAARRYDQELAGIASSVSAASPSLIEALMLRFPAARKVSTPGTPLGPNRHPDRSSGVFTVRSAADQISIPGTTRMGRLRLLASAAATPNAWSMKDAASAWTPARESPSNPLAAA